MLPYLCRDEVINLAQAVHKRFVKNQVLSSDYESIAK